jgi:hypothetical protein
MKRSIQAIVLSLLMVAYGPIVTMTSAQAATDSKVSAIKQKAQKEIDRRLDELKETLKNLEQDVQLQNQSLDSSLSVGGGSTDLSSLKTVQLQDKAKAQVVRTVKDIIKKLEALKASTTNIQTVADAQQLAKSIDSQQKLDQVANAQAAVTKSLESFTVVFDRLKTSANDIQSQVTKLRSCTQNSSDNREGCDSIPADSEELAKSAQAQMDSVATMLSTIGSLLLSAIALLETVATNFNDILDELGDEGDLTELGDISNATGIGSLSGHMSSLTAIAAQLDIASGMNGNAQALLGGVTAITASANF